MKNWLSWVDGRQNSGYSKLLLLQSQWLKFDLYVLRFKQGVGIPPHTDPVEKGRHYRFNVVVHSAGSGGQFLCDQVIWSFANRVFFFRPDLSTHSVSQVESGSRYVLSLGWLRGLK